MSNVHCGKHDKIHDSLAPCEFCVLEEQAQDAQDALDKKKGKNGSKKKTAQGEEGNVSDADGKES